MDAAAAAHFLEAAMLVCFGLSWPFSIRKTLKMRSGGSKSYAFFGLILAGYLMGVVKEIIEPSWVVYFYIADAALVGTDMGLCLYFARRQRGEGQS
ncbi:MAG: hypothetical protein LBP75_10925 [Planctomycetota bacterium]|jgi:hypothetical protein|nr:hypothetical protein [Planctomycetota bacterium]